MGSGAASVITRLTVGALLGLASGFAPARAASPKVSPAKLEAEIATRLGKVEEFRFIRAEAEKLGVRVYLFGGTAAGFAHYVKWDLLREAGDPRYQADRFDYDFTNIFRSTQDLDIVVDGTDRDARRLSELLLNSYPNFQGSKDQWEVRLLRKDMGDKQALLNNPDFLNQHTDSNSTGLIEVTTRPHESAVKDLRDWNSSESQFLRDVAEGKIHYYFSDSHETTSRFRQGMNPPILSVVRFLTKAFQYELEVRPEDERTIRKIIADYDPAARQNSYVGTWLEKNASKLIRHAVNIEYAWNESERLGLRKKLVEARTGPRELQSMGWWLQKEPLRSKPLGSGNGKTAKELGISIVAHETNSFLSYESITRAHTGDPNVLISRQGRQGEMAAYGDGFYTAKGKEGMAGTGWTIRFKMDPRARSGTDFTVHGAIVLVHNKRAIRVVPEGLKTTLMGFLRLIEGIDHSDRGILEKARRRIANQKNVISPEELREARDLIANRSLDPKKTSGDPVLGEWLRLPFALENLDLVEDLLKRNYFPQQIFNELIMESDSPKLAKLIDSTLGSLDRRAAERAYKFLLEKPVWKNHPKRDDWVRTLAKTGATEPLSEFLSRIATPARDGSYVTEIHEATRLHEAILRCVTRLEWNDHPAFGRAVAFAIRDGYGPKNFTSLTKARLSPAARATLGAEIESFLNKHGVYGDGKIQEFYARYSELANEGGTTLSAKRVATSVVDRLRYELPMASTNAKSIEIINVLGSFGAVGINEVIASFEAAITKKPTPEAFGGFGPALSRGGYLANAAVARIYLERYASLDSVNRMEIISSNLEVSSALVVSIETLGTSSRAAKTAVRDLIAERPLSSFPHPRLFALQAAVGSDPVAEARLRAEFFAMAPSTDMKIMHFLNQTRTQGAESYREFFKPGFADVYFDALTKMQVGNDQFERRKRADLAAALALSPAVFDPAKRKILIEATRGSPENLSRHKFVEFVDQGAGDYRRLVDFAAFDVTADFVIWFGQWPDFDLAKFRAAFEETRKGNPYQIDRAFGNLHEFLADQKTFKPDYHAFLKERLEVSQFNFERAAPLFSYAVRHDLLKRDPAFVEFILTHPLRHGGMPDFAIIAALEEARTIAAKKPLTTTQRQLLQRMFKEIVDNYMGMDRFVTRTRENAARHTQLAHEILAVDFYESEFLKVHAAPRRAAPNCKAVFL